MIKEMRVTADVVPRTRKALKIFFTKKKNRFLKSEGHWSRCYFDNEF